MLNNIYHDFKKAVDEYGVDITIMYRTSIPCSCSSLYDPVYKTKSKYNCSTCDGSGLSWSSTVKPVKGILNQFSRGLAALENGKFVYNVDPKGQARLTIWLDNVLVNLHSQTGPTYFTNCSTVIAYGYKFKPKNTTRIGWGDSQALIVSLEKVGV